MAIDRFELLDRLFQQAVALDTGERTGFLEQACAGDEELQTEVEALLEADSQAEDFIERAVVSGSQLLRARKDPFESLSKVGKYEILDVIGEGGFGIVYKGRDTVLQRHVAIKVCTSQNPDLRRRFVREAEIAAGLQHPNITTLHDLGQEGNWSYLVQELLGGEDLAAKITRHEPLSLDIRLSILLQVARGLHHAHEEGVLHRDIKPANVRVLGNGRVKIMDFGIARWLGEETGLTRDGQSLGTVGYLSPEQLRNEEPDRRADLFAFGVLAYELLSYEKPFQGESFSQVSYQVLYEKARALGKVWPDCPAVVERIVHRCLEKNPRKRFPSLADVIAALEPLVEGGRSGSIGRSSAVLTRPPANRWGLSGPRLWGGVVAVMIAGAVAWWGFSTSRTSPTLDLQSTSASQPAVSPAGGEALAQVAENRVRLGEDAASRGRQGSGDAISDKDRASGERSVAVAQREETLAGPSGLAAEPDSGSGAFRDDGSLRGRNEASERAPVSRGTLSREQVTGGLAPMEPEPSASSRDQGSSGLEGSRVGSEGEGEGVTSSPEPQMVVLQGAESAPAGDSLPDSLPDTASSRPFPSSGEVDALAEASQILPAVEGQAMPGSTGVNDSGTPQEPAIGLEEGTPPSSSEGAQPDSLTQALLSEGPGVIKPGLQERPTPVYPESARRRRREALVVVAVLVDSRGQVERTLIKRRDDSGLGFNEAAIAAAKSARFHPATRNGEAGRMWTEISFDFLLQ